MFLGVWVGVPVGVLVGVVLEAGRFRPCPCDSPRFFISLYMSMRKINDDD